MCPNLKVKKVSQFLLIYGYSTHHDVFLLIINAKIMKTRICNNEEPLSAKLGGGGGTCSHDPFIFFLFYPLFPINAPIIAKPQRGGGVRRGLGILTFSEKMSQILHLQDDIIGQKYQKPPPWGE